MLIILKMKLNIFSNWVGTLYSKVYLDLFRAKPRIPDTPEKKGGEGQEDSKLEQLMERNKQQVSQGKSKRKSY